MSLSRMKNEKKMEKNLTECIVYMLWPFNLFFLVLFLFDWMGALWLQLSKVLKPVRWASSPFSPSVPAEAGCLFAVAAGVHVFISGESLHCFLVGWCTNKSSVIATSDL